MPDIATARPARRPDWEAAAERVLASLAAVPKRDVREARRAPRFPYPKPIDLYLISAPGHATVPAVGRNLSNSGIGLVSRRPFVKGELFATLLNYGPNLGKFILCRVAFCRYAAEGFYEVGAQFEASEPVLGANAKVPDAWYRRT